MHTLAPWFRAALIFARLPDATASSASARSKSICARMACASGSPMRQLNSSNLGPSTVNIRPKYKNPLYGRPSPAIPRTAGRTIVSKIVCSRSGASRSSLE